MLGILSSFAGLIKTRSSHTVVDDSIFRLHYRWTTSLCFVGCILVATSELVGDPIQCLVEDDDTKAITTYCWVMSTFTINSTIARGEYGPYESYNSKFHGIGQYDEEKHTKRVHAYYQWVPFVLFTTGCLFYVPHLIWKEVEGKRVDNMLQGLNVISIDEANAAKRNNLVQYLYASRGILNGRYAFGYFIAQILNLAVVLSVVSFLDVFIGGSFTDYGIQIIRYLNGDPDITHNPLVVAFPRVTKCSFEKFGPSGTIEKRDILCLLPQNIMNEKIFLVLWFWLNALTTLTCINVLFIACQFVSPQLRQKLLENYGKMVSSGELENFLRDTTLGDYFLLVSLGKNLDAISFKDVMENLIRKTRAGNINETGMAVTLEQPPSMFSPHAPSYRHFNIEDEEEEPVDYKRRMAASDAADGFTADTRV